MKDTKVKDNNINGNTASKSVEDIEPHILKKYDLINKQGK
jgi:hypothetical protein